MSDKHTVLGKVVDAILSIFKSNWKTFVTKLWDKIPDELKTELLDIVGIVNKIKQYADSTIIDVITQVIPGDADDKAVAWAREQLTKIVQAEDIANKKISELTRGNYQTIASELTVAATGLDYGQAAISVENAYQNS